MSNGMLKKYYQFELGQVCSRLSSGKGIAAKEISEHGIYPVFGGNGLRGYSDKKNFEGQCAIIGRQGAFCGNVRFFSGEAYMTEHAVVVCANEKSDIKYLSYLLGTMNLGRLSGQSAQPGLSVKTLSKQVIQLPDISEQRQITKVLSSFDDKIELNAQINHNLEEQAKCLVKSWFVDFEPYGGQVPDSWHEITLSEIADFIGGYSYKGAELQPSSCAMATIKNFDRTGGFKLDGYKEIIPSDKLKDSQKVELFDILVAHTDLTQKAEVIGNAEMVLSKSGYDEIIMSMDLVKVLPKHGISRFVLAALLRTDQFKDHALGYVNGTTVLHMSKKALPAFTLYFPEKFSELSEISCMLEAIYKKIAQNIEESRSLVKLRDTLLPKLMSGEIDVSEVEI